MTIYEYFSIHRYRQIVYNDKKYDCDLGLDTGDTSGYYKNGYKTYRINGKNDKYHYIQVNMYTICGGKVEIEEKMMIRSDNKIVQRVGFHNVNLLKYDTQENHKKDIMDWIERMNFLDRTKILI